MTERAAEQSLPIIKIEPAKGWIALDLPALWEYRELLYFLTWRDIKVRYKQTVLGASWAILQPLFTMVVFSLFFGKLAQAPSDDIPCPIFSYAALAVLRQRAEPIVQQHGGQRQSHRKGRYDRQLPSLENASRRPQESCPQVLHTPRESRERNPAFANGFQIGGACLGAE